MKWHQLPTVITRRHMNLLFDGDCVEGLEAPDRDKVVATLAHLLMQAVGLRVEEVDDDNL
jgi:hypothetical protein